MILARLRPPSLPSLISNPELEEGTLSNTRLCLCRSAFLFARIREFTTRVRDARRDPILLCRCTPLFYLCLLISPRVDGEFRFFCSLLVAAVSHARRLK